MMPAISEDSTKAARCRGGPCRTEDHVPRPSMTLVILSLTVFAPAARAQDIGLLLGLAGPDDRDSVPLALTTEWVVISGGAARQVHTLPGLVVPRTSGFWRMSLIRACAPPDSTDPFLADRVHCYDSVWVAPAGQPIPPVTESWVEPCTTEFVEVHFFEPPLAVGLRAARLLRHVPAMGPRLGIR